MLSDDDAFEDLLWKAGTEEDDAPGVGVDADRDWGVGADGLPSATGERCGVNTADKQHGLVR